jgi:multiple sugar transport system ATP-binding protein
MVFQNYALYPHMSVYDNIAFPLRQQRLKKRELRSRVEEAAKLLGINEFLARKPRELSGGQRQRVAIGRALVRRPQAFLMDEPLSNLDAKLRVQMRAELLNLHQRLGITTIYVTHDQTEAMTLGDRVAVLNKGVVQQVEAPARLYRRPVNTFVASFIGSPAMNFLRGELSDGSLRVGPYALRPPRLDSRVAGPVLVGLRPEDFVVANGSPQGVVLPARVEITEQLGPEVLVHFRLDGVETAILAPEPEQREDAPSSLSDALVARLDAGFQAARGDAIPFAVREDRLQLFDPASGQALT